MSRKEKKITEIVPNALKMWQVFEVF